MTLVVRTLPSAFDPPDGTVTVATPSCCCCCCCCLVASGVVVGFTAGEAHYQARERRQQPGRMSFAVLLGVAAVPGAFGGFVFLLNNGGRGATLAGLLAYPILAIAAYLVAGMPLGRSLATTVLTVAAFAVMASFEVAPAVATQFLFELLLPVGIWVGWLIARARHRGRTKAAAILANPHPR
ncbi:MAG: hypothetical protein M3P52_06590 [Actinomycetota bacterium]|nr:hypothetical protein [Actinomycetota bacterium]